MSNPLLALINSNITQANPLDRISAARTRIALAAIVNQLQKDIVYNTSIPFDSLASNMAGKQLTTSDVFTPNNTGAIGGGGTILVLTGDGTHMPDFSAFRNLNGGQYDKTANTSNTIVFIYNGVNYCVSIFQDVPFVVLTTPAAPTAGTVNDTNGIDSFDFTYNPTYTTPADYEYTLDSGTSVTALSAKPLVVGNVAKAIGQVGIRVKAHAGTNPSPWLFNTSAFTVSGGGGGAAALNPSVLNATIIVSGTEIDLAWSDTNSSPNESNVLVQRSLSATSGFTTIATLSANATSYNDSGLTPSTTYYYKIINQGNGSTTLDSAASNIVNGTTTSGVWSYAQNFDAVIPPAMPADWVHTGAFTAAYGSAISSPNVMEMPSSGSAVMTAMKNAVDGNSGNIRVSINIRVVTASPHEFILVGRASTTTWGTMTAYGLKIWINNGTSATNGVSLLKGVGGTFNALGSGTSVGNGATLAANVWYKFTLVMTDVGGSTKVDAIVQRVSDGFYLNSSGTFVTGAEQIAYTNTDSSPITGAGYGGIASFIVNTAEHVMDDFLMTQ